MYGYTYGYPSGGGAGAVSGFESAVLSDGGTVVAIGNTTDLYSRLLGLGLINSASLVNSCNGGKADALYNFVPSPVQSLDRFVVTRASTKLRIGSDGLYGSVANNVPAFEFNTDGTYRGLLVEPGATNLALQSQTFESGSWNKTGVGTGLAPVVTQNVAVAPDGTTTADLIVFDRGAGNTITDRSVFAQAPTVVNATAYTASFFLKAATGADVGKQIAIRSVAGSGYGVITLTANWVRYERAETSVSTTGNIELASRGTVTTDNTVSVHAWQAQLETGSVATSPIVTTAGTASRVADVVSLTGASSLIGQTSGTLYCEVIPIKGSIQGTILSIDDNNGVSIANRHELSITTAGLRRYEVRSGGVNQVDINPATDLSGQTWRIAIGYAQDDFVMVYNGASVGTDTSGLLPAGTPSRVRIGGRADNSTPLIGHVRAVALFPTRLPNATLASLTA